MAAVRGDCRGEPCPEAAGAARGLGTPLASDSSDYREMALLLMDGRPFVPYWPPGLSLYLVPFLRAGLGDAGLRAAMLPWWLLFCLGFLRLSADLGVKKRISLVLLAVFSVTPALIHFSIEPMTQMPSAALLLLALSAAMRCSRRGGWGEALLLGLACGGLSLVRPSAIPLMIALPALVFLRRRRVAEPLAAVALGSVLIFAWMVKVHQLSGQWTINNSNGANLYYGNNPWTPLYRTWYFGSHAKPGTEEIHQFPEYERIVRRVMTLPKTDRGAEFKQLAMEYVLHRPDLFVLRTVNRVRCFWGFDTFTAANLHGAGGAGRRWFVPVFGMDAICYLMIAGYAFFWIAAAPAGLWSRWETWLLTATIVLYGASVLGDDVAPDVSLSRDRSTGADGSYGAAACRAGGRRAMARLGCHRGAGRNPGGVDVLPYEIVGDAGPCGPEPVMR